MSKIKIIKTSEEKQTEIDIRNANEEFNKLHFEKCPHCGNDDNITRSNLSHVERIYESYWINYQICKKCGTEWEWYQKSVFDKGITDKPWGVKNLTFENKIKFVAMCFVGFIILIILSLITN